MIQAPAARTYNGTYSLTISARLPEPYETGNQAMSESPASIFLPLTMGKTFDSEDLFNDGGAQMINLTRRQNRALTILHEFAHALGIIPRDAPRVDPTGQQSFANTQTLYEKCGGAIEALVPLD